jgi:hypothetical protein
MIYYDSKVYVSNKVGKTVCRIKTGLKVVAFDKDLHHVHRHIISVLKRPRRTPYRLVTESLKYSIDTYPSISFMVRKPTGEKVVKRIGEIKDEEEFMLWVNGGFHYEKAISFVKDTAVSRFYEIRLGKPALVPVNHFMMKFEGL